MPNTDTIASDKMSKIQKTAPAPLLKQLRATVAVLCYDHAFGLPTIPSSEFQTKLMNMYNGNESLNMISQVELMCGGKGKYMNMYNFVQNVVINADTEAKDPDDSPSSSLVLCPALLAFDTHIRYVSGEHFTAAMSKCPTKNLSREICSDRFLLDLSKQAVANIKKASIVADEYLVNNEKPSGTSWDDLYQHLIDSADRINPKEKFS